MLFDHFKSFPFEIMSFKSDFIDDLKVINYCMIDYCFALLNTSKLSIFSLCAFYKNSYFYFQI